MHGKDAEHEALMTAFMARFDREDNPAPLDTEAILTAYEARYGKEDADWERNYLATCGDGALLRLDVIQRAMSSRALLD
jgi:hypothetical protein